MSTPALTALAIAPGEVGRDVVRGLQRRHVAVVADHDALEAHLVAQMSVSR